MAILPRSHFGGNSDVYRTALMGSMDMYSADGVMSQEGAEAARKTLAVSLVSVRDAHVDLGTTYTNEFLADQ